MPGIANGLASPNASRPICLGRSPDLRVDHILQTAPSRAGGTVVIAVWRSLTVAWAAPALHPHLDAHRLPVSPRGGQTIPWDT